MQIASVRLAPPLLATGMAARRARQIGRSVLMQLRAADQVLEDPEIDEYVESLGHRLSAHAQDGDQSFEFFIVNDGAINAFALPGGYIGVNGGLILATQRESELAGVLAHEIAHVTQKHIARRAAAQGRSSMLAGAAVLAAILMGVTGQATTDVVQATAMSRRVPLNSGTPSLGTVIEIAASLPK